MKQSITIALSAILALAPAAPLEKRDGYTTTVIEDVTDIVDVYTTVYVSPGDSRLTQNQQPVTQTPSSAPVVSVTPSLSTSAIQTSAPSPTTSKSPMAVPQQKLEAEVQAPAPTTTPIPSVTPQPVVQPKVEAAAPVQSSAAPAPSQSTSSASTSSSGPSGGSCGEVNGKCTAGDVTTFDGSGAAGACGETDPDVTPDYVALAVGKLPLCNDTL